ncbi:protocadherin Fat 1 isoform X3 [Astyanax mexicanus]|uniref:protocadherin Fat 1 isoform X3 n=1 Tax=Astyanax mexicanus TaxID=7994 RepID=UPI0020CB50A7|nr:protocadherin Fat 1 isoform X3 [Astyanax mexicanus]
MGKCWNRHHHHHHHIHHLLIILLFWTCVVSQQMMDTLPLKFTQSLYNATIYENSAAKTFADCPVKMGIFIQDQSWDIWYRIESGDHEKLFKAEKYVLGDFSFLRIRTKGGSSSTLNREVKDQFLLSVQAIERHSGAEALTQVRLRVLDANDLRPLFSPTSYSVSVPESTPIRTSIGRVFATDADAGTNGEFYFSFKEWTSVFSVHPTSGVVSLTGKLDYLETPQYEIDVLAVDRGLKLYGKSDVSSTAKLTVQVLQSNDHAPVVTAVPLIPWNTTTKDPTYAFVTVEDDDLGQSGEIASLSIVAGDPLQQFKAIRTSPGSKEYKIKANKEVAWEGFDFGYNLTLQAKDKGSPPKFSPAVVVQVKPPLENMENVLRFEKSIYRVTLSEFAPPHSQVVMVRTVQKDPNVRYSLQYKMHKHRNPFVINPNTGLITTVEHVQAERVSQYELNVIATINRDHRQASTLPATSAKVVVNVIDMNDNAPKFQQSTYAASVDENTPIGTSVLSVSAIDKDEGENGYVTYSIVNLVNKKPFIIDYFTGVISISDTLDYEMMPSKFYLKVRASDWGSPFRREAETVVAITLNNLNDNQPLFENIDCEVTVPRSFRVGEQIIVVSAIDADDLGIVRYEITAGNDQNLFDLDPNSGVLTLKNSLIKLIDAAKPRASTFYSLQIQANDGKISSSPMYVNITVVGSLQNEEIRSKCAETEALRTLAGMLLFGSKLHHEIEFTDTLSENNNNAPQFMGSNPTEIEVKEDVPAGSDIVRFRATDADVGFNGKLLFVISDGNVDSRFMIETDTGWLKIGEPLDRETTDHYTLNITVYDLGLPQKSSSYNLKISVIDVNDNSPEFLENEYTVDVSEDCAVGTDIIQLEAVDKDLGVNGKVIYSFLTKSDHFAINNETGVVTVQKPLDREANPSFVLKVAAHDQATQEPPLISTTILTIILEDVNDIAPIFYPSNYYRIRIREDIPVGTLILWIEASDPDLGQSGQVRYSLTDDAEGSFQLDKVSGALYLAQPLDFERKQTYNLTAKAKDKGKPVSLSSLCFIEVETVDVSENLYRPSFPFFVDWGSVSEDAPVGSSVMKVTAHDEDEGRDGELRYTIHDGSGLGVFTIDQMSGVISTKELLDRETTSHYWLTVYATDQGVVPLSSSVEVYIDVQDVNDNAPQTSEPVYYSSVPENSPKDVSIMQIQAFDPDSKSSDRLTYKITSGNPQGFFTVDLQTGLVTTTSRKLDREKQGEHILEVTVSDDGAPAMSTVVRLVVKVEDENDNPPQFLEKVYKIRLVERPKAIRWEPVYRVIAQDRDESPYSEISYSIEEGDEHRKFFIEPKTGLISSKEAFSAGDYHILTIKALDNGRPQKSSICRLHIEWIAKPEPPKEPLVFEEASLQFSAMESDPVGHMVGVISTQSLDSPVWFDIKGDSHTKEVFHIVQMACDLNCRTEGGNDDSRFDVEKASGTLIIAKALDAEQQLNYNLTVEATDGSRSISTQISVQVIDTNEHRPKFTQTKYEISIPEETEPGMKILEISATDKDEKNKLFYTLLSSTDPHSLKKFHLDPGTGFLYTTDELDHETMHRHTLTVMVRDQDVPVKRNLARVIISVEDGNDNAPWFTSSRYSSCVLETAAVGSAVLQVTALDKDKGQNAEIFYSIDSGNHGNSFSIDPFQGIIKVAGELSSDQRSQYELEVKASDKGEPPLSVFTTVSIKVTISDNAEPKFHPGLITAEISEAAPVGSLVTAVVAYSQSSVFYQIIEGNVNGAFDINPNSGAVVTRRTLDYETLSSYKLTVRGTNMAGMASEVTVHILVKDENDNAPVFDQTEFVGFISEAASPRSVVLTVENTPLVIHATDADEDANARLVYQIVEPFAHNYFSIDSGTGAIQTISSLDYEGRSAFHFTVQAHDTGLPRLFTRQVANVTVFVKDVNDCAPRFSQNSFETTLLVPTYKGVKVISLNATDSDFPSNDQKLLYSIVDGNVKNKFRIDSVTGEIFVQNATQLRSRYILTVRVSDGKFTSNATVKITIRDNKGFHHGLKFNQETFTAFIEENSTGRKTLAIISAVGNKLNEPLVYSILNPDERFDVGRTSGVLFTTGIPFDREEQDVFDVIVEVTTEQKDAKTAHVLVKVMVEDVNDNAPMFVNLPYSSIAQMDTEVGTVLGQVTAVDSDVDQNSEIKYHLKGNDDHFHISPSGEISLKKAFKQEHLNTRFVINIIAEDQGDDHALSSTAEVTITVVNKATPVFERPFYKIEIPEDVELRTAIVQVLANESVGPRTVYRIYEGDPLGHFYIDFNTGVIEVVQKLDYETHPAHRLSIQAMDSLTGAHSEVFVDIILEDVNDNAPVFDRKLYNISVSESAVIGTSVLQVSARDMDTGSNKEISYQLFTKNGTAPSDHFRIDGQSGVIWTTALLDYETKPKHELTIKALDGGASQLYSEVLVTVHVTDLNDNPPIFMQHVYNATVSNLSPTGHFVTCVQASDPDSMDMGKLEFSILSGNEDNIFAIDKKTGEIFISSHWKLMGTHYNLFVFTTDGVFTAFSEVKVKVIDSNQQSPSFVQDEYIVELLENSAVGTLVTQVEVLDKDPGIYGQVTLHIVNDVARDKFTLNADGQIHTADIFDRENPLENVMYIYILAKDGGGKVGFCTVIVILSDINDNAPQFRLSEYKAMVQRDVPKGTTVMKISAVDEDEGANADIAYEIDSDIGHFEIHPVSGAVVTKGSLMEVENGLYSFYVKAKDSGSPPRQSVIPVSIKVLPSNVSVPKFAEGLLWLELSEDLPVGTEIDTVRSERGKQPVIYSLVRGNTPQSNRDDVFVINSHSGRLKLGKRLDYEAVRWYQLSIQVKVTEEGVEFISVTEVNIHLKDVNDNSPQFDSLPYQSFILENLPGGTSVVQVRATDLDSGLNGQVTYSLDRNQESPEVLELFAVDSETGWVSTVAEIDREKRNKYRIAVISTDGAQDKRMTGSTVVEVTVVDSNDNPPVFTKALYKATVMETESTAGTVITALSTTDLDSEEANRRFNCFITGGDPRGQFSLQYVDGACLVLTAKALDREEREHYLLNITVTDGTYTAQTAVELAVLDANDNSPVCEKGPYAGAVPENAPAGKFILQVSASDPDIQSNAEIAYRLTGDGSESFRMDSATGVLKTLLPLDREERGEYNLTVQAVDGGNRSCEADVIITVIDVNDNAPVFSSELYYISVYDNTQPGAYLSRLQAYDADTGLNSRVSYRLEDSAGGLFSIEEQSGIISLLKPLSDQVKSGHRLQVRATDHGSPRTFSSLCSVEVTVLDANHRPPVFQHRDYTTTVPEDVSPGTLLLSVFAASGHPQANAQTSYSISSGNEQGAFSIDSHTGNIFVIAALDYEAAREHYLMVKATDGGQESLSDTVTVTIHLSDINDNSPAFSQQIYSAVISEDSEPGCSVLTVMANDLDGPSNSRIHYSILKGNEDSPFIMDAVSGVLKVARQLDREKVGVYKLTVLASDSGNPPKSSSAAINMTVADVNDNPPVFSRANYSLVVQESLPAGASVLQLNVTDRDTPQNVPPFSYSILKGNEGKQFSIDQQGVIRTTSPLKRSVKDQYVLQVQVTDSGKPPLQSSTLVNLHVAQTSVHPPSVLPLEVFILVPGEEYPAGGVVGKVHASDLDEYDTLNYTLQPPGHDLFSVSDADGRLLARRGLDVGRYPLNVLVSDGRFSSSASVTVHVQQVTQQMLEGSVSVQFAGVSAEDFLQEHWRNFQRVIRSLEGIHSRTGLDISRQSRADVQILSLQPVESGADLEVLLFLERSGDSGSSLELLLQNLNSSSAALQELGGLRLVRVLTRRCSTCPDNMCRQEVTLDTSIMAAYSTARVGYVTPRHHVTPRCLCRDGKCPGQKQGCGSNPCPEGYHCLSLQGEKYHCICPLGKKEKCSGGSSVTFSENSYIKYHVKRSTREEIKISLKLKTFSIHGTVMFVKGRGYSVLEVVRGRLQFQFDCGSGLATMTVHSVQVNDGQWHSVELEVKGNRARLVLDRLHSASGISPGALPCLGLEKQVILGGRAVVIGSRPRRSLPLSGSLQGCMDAVMVNGQSLFLHSEGLAGVVLEDVEGVSPGCGVGITPSQDCANKPCLNGGSCSQRPNGDYHCTCSGLFTGAHCELSISPCVSNPCLYGGTCIQNNERYYCRCRGQYTGQRCETGPYCKQNPCRNGGHCIDSLDGPACECEPGFRGERCQLDVDECLHLPCLNGGWCVNTFGSFNCSCSPGFSGSLCEMESEVHNVFISNSWNISLGELVGVLIFLVAIFILALLFALVRTGMCRSTKSEEEKEKYRAIDAYIQRTYLDSKTSRGTFLDGPPQVPVRPLSYNPSVPADSRRKDVDRGCPPEFSSFTPDTTFGVKKSVAVCSVAPNLPQRRASRSPAHSHSIRKPDSEEEDEEEERMSSKRGSTQGLADSFQFTDDSNFHWDTSDWMHGAQVPGFQSLLQYEFVQTPSMYSDINDVYPRPPAPDRDYRAEGGDYRSCSLPPPEFPPYNDLHSHTERWDKSGWPQAHAAIARLPGRSSTALGQQQQRHGLDHPPPNQTIHGVPQGSIQGPFEFQPGSVYSGRARQEGHGRLPGLLDSSAPSLSDLSDSGDEADLMALSRDDSASSDVSTPIIMRKKDSAH